MTEGVPPARTVTSTSPAACAGAVALMEVSERIVKEVARADPKLTLVASRKPLPVIVTVVPPAEAPAVGLTPVTVAPR